MGRKFKVGDRVRYALKAGGAVAIVTEVGARFRDTDGRIRHDGVRVNFMTRNPENILRGLCRNAIYSPEVLKHDYDGTAKVSWSDCVWKPRELARAREAVSGL